ncbi:MAG: hypothetical protein HPY71_02905 [Firmicutes bacterium]|nr:hypothetical protein [Bacillota bacterium]
MKRVVSLGLTTNPRPSAHRPQETIFSPHVESVSSGRGRAEIFSHLKVTKFRIGQADEVAEIEQTVDPLPGTHLESYYPRRPWYPDVLGRDVFVRDLTQIPTSELATEAAVIDLSKLGRQAITAKDLEQAGSHVREGDMVLVRTGFSDQYYGTLPGLESYSNSPGFTMDAAQWLVDKKVNTVGIDFRHLEAPEVLANGGDMRVHEVFHINKIAIIEDVTRLGQLKGKRVFAACGRPLKTRYLTGAATRLMALEEGKLIDLSHPLSPRIEVGADQGINRSEPFRFKSHIYKWMNIVDFNLWDFGMTAATGPQLISYVNRLGTHLLSASTTDKIPIQWLFGRSEVIDLYHCGASRLIDTRLLQEALKNKTPEALVVHTGFTDWYYDLDEFIDYSPSFTEDAAQMLVDRGVKLLVVDIPVIDRQIPSEGKEVEQKALGCLLKNDVLVVACAANMNLLRQRNLDILVLPLPIAGLTSVPTDIIAVEEWLE